MSDNREPNTQTTSAATRCACGNFARVGNLTCNACRAVTEVAADAAAAKAADDAIRAVQAEQYIIVDAIPIVHCSCGNHARLWKEFGFWEIDHEDTEFDEAIPAYRSFIEGVRRLESLICPVGQP